MGFAIDLNVDAITRLQLESQWGLEHDAQADFKLAIRDDCLCLSSKALPKLLPLQVDFLSGKAAYRRKHGGGQHQTIAKAVGIKPNKPRRVLDATAGLGRDAFVLAGLGCLLTLLERHQVVAALLDDGLKRAYQDSFIGSWMQEKMCLCSHTSLQQLVDQDISFDVVFLDPMYPHRKKNALVKKEMQLLQALVGADDDADSLLKPALVCARERVVVKRPLDAPYLDNTTPTLIMPMKNNRFDVYLC
jgi:16S rRNA (guanine1516-N2)-methyltransferase